VEFAADPIHSISQVEINKIKVDDVFMPCPYSQVTTSKKPAI
jgi:hypothetical protein